MLEKVRVGDVLQIIRKNGMRSFNDWRLSTKSFRGFVSISGGKSLPNAIDAT